MQSETPVAPLPADPVLPVEGGKVAALQVPAAPGVPEFVTPSASSEPTRVAILLDSVAPTKRSDTVALRVVVPLIEINNIATTQQAGHCREHVR